MGWLSEENSSEEQIEHYTELLKSKQEQFETLKDVTGSPEAEAQRNQLFEQIKQIEITIAEIKQMDGQEKGEDQNEGLDLFLD